MKALSVTDFFSSNHQAKILVVDDLRSNRKYLISLLSELGYAVGSVDSAYGALELLNYSQPDLLLLDIVMPKMDGYTLCKIIKENQRLKDIPVIFISSLQEVVDKVRAFRVGAVDYIIKPFEPLELFMRIENQLKLQSLQKALIRQNRNLEQEIKRRQQVEQKLMLANFELEKLAGLDDLTGVANRRKFEVILKKYWQKLQTDQLPLSLIICDIDYFKKYNDFYGHIQGDKCLSQVAECLKKTVKRPDDFVARYGGEEFMIILPRTDLEGAVKISNNIQKSIARLAIENKQSDISKYITVSLGISSLIPRKELSPELLKITADQALYLAKKQGRNCCEVWLCDYSGKDFDQVKLVEQLDQTINLLDNQE
jgi:diguanylate cyclase (GGDEF)-like protein